MSGIARLGTFGGLCGAAGGLCGAIHFVMDGRHRARANGRLNAADLEPHAAGGAERAPLSLLPHIAKISGCILISSLSIGVALFLNGAPLLSKKHLVNMALSTVGVVAAAACLASIDLQLATRNVTIRRNEQQIGGVNKDSLFGLSLASFFVTCACVGLLALRRQPPFAALRTFAAK